MAETGDFALCCTLKETSAEVKAQRLLLKSQERKNRKVRLQEDLSPEDQHMRGT